MIEIVLSVEQYLRAARVGFERQILAVRNGRTPRHRNGSLWGANIEGACAELAASIATGLPWTGEHLFTGAAMPRERKPDIGEATEVRWSMSTPPVLQFDERHDADDWKYVLVSGVAPTFIVHGSIRGARCRSPWWRHEYPERVVFRVPTSALTPITADTHTKEASA